jgi:hypothetical protein
LPKPTATPIFTSSMPAHTTQPCRATISMWSTAGFCSATLFARLTRCAKCLRSRGRAGS